MKNKRKIKYYVLAFLFPLCCQIVSYAMGGFFPFGDKTVLVWDMDIQYISFFSWLNQVLKNQSVDSMLYSFSLSFGGSTVGLIGYYLLSPFNILLLPFSTKWLPVGVQMISVLKICCCGLTMYHYLRKRFEQECYGAVLFSGMYALMGYTVTQQSNIMWLDGVVLLPILLLNVYHLIVGKKVMQYPIWIMAAIVADFYIAYMMILFSFVYFLVEWVMLKKTWRWKEFFRAAFVLAGNILLGVGLSCAIFLPVIYEIFSIGRGGTGGVIESVLALFQMRKDLFMLPLKCLIGAYDRQQLIHGLPNIYVSLYCFPFVLLFFLDRRNPKQEKACAAASFLFFLFSFSSIGLNQVWHGFTYASGSNFRYSFCASFLVIIVGYRQYLNICSTRQLCRVSKWSLPGLLLAAFWGVMAAYAQFKMDIYEFSSIKKWLLSLLMGIGACLFACALRWTGLKKRNILYLLMTLAVGVELAVNMDWSMQDFTYRGLEEYQDYAEVLENTYKQLANENPGVFFRMENELRDLLNDAMLIGYPSVTHYSSTIRNEVAEYAISHHMLAEGYGRQATIYEIGRADAEETGKLAIKYLLIPVLPDEMEGWEIKEETPFYILENKMFKPLCYLREETGGRAEIDIENSAKIKINVFNIGDEGNELLTSIPDRKGWQIKVDGKSYFPQNEDLMIQVNLLQGNHEIVLEYKQPMAVTGLLISILSLSIWCMLFLTASGKRESFF